MSADVAVVTGAGRGLGREVAERLVRRGLRVVVTDVDGLAAEQTAALLGGGAVGLGHDVRDPEAHRRVAAEAVRHGRLAVWVNNAGVLWTGKAWEHSDEQVRRTVEVDLLGVIWGCRAAVDVMRSQSGRADIVNIASMAALAPIPGLAAYSAAKSGVLHYSGALMGDLQMARLRRIRVHAVCPDTIDTPMVSEVAHTHDAAMQFTAPRLLTAGEVADAAVALIGTRRLVRTIPASRAAQARLGAFLPGLTMRLALPLLYRVGDRRRRRVAAGPGGGG